MKNYILVFIIYFILAKSANLFDLPGDFTSIFFPALGMGIAALLVFGKRMLLPIFLAYLCSFISYNYDLLSKFTFKDIDLFFYLSVAIIGTFQVYLGYLLTRKFFDKEPYLISPKEAFYFLLKPTLIVPMVGALSTLFRNIFLNEYTISNSIYVSAVWFLGDATGLVFGLITFLVLFKKFDGKIKSRKIFILFYSIISLTFLSLFFLLFTTHEKKSEKSNFELLAQTMSYRVDQNLKNLESRIRDLRNLFYSSDYVTFQEFDFFLSDIFKTYRSVDYFVYFDKNEEVKYLTPLYLSKEEVSNLISLDSLMERMGREDQFYLEIKDKKLIICLPVYKLDKGFNNAEVKGGLVTSIDMEGFIRELLPSYYLKNNFISLTTTSFGTFYSNESSFKSPKYKSTAFFFNHLIRAYDMVFSLDFYQDENKFLNKAGMQFIFISFVGLFISFLLAYLSLVHSSSFYFVFQKQEKEIDELKKELKKISNSKNILINLVKEISDELQTISITPEINQKNMLASLVSDIAFAMKLREENVLKEVKPFLFEEYKRRLEDLFNLVSLDLDTSVVFKTDLNHFNFLEINTTYYDKIFHLLFRKHLEYNFRKKYVISLYVEKTKDNKANLVLSYSDKNFNEFTRDFNFNLVLLITEKLSGRIKHKVVDGEDVYSLVLPVVIYSNESDYSQALLLYKT